MDVIEPDAAAENVAARRAVPAAFPIRNAHSADGSDSQPRPRSLESTMVPLGQLSSEPFSIRLLYDTSDSPCDVR